MNRSWIRMTLNASIDERQILERERDDSKKLIHDAIEMFTQLEDLNMELYEKEILPKLIEIILILYLIKIGYIYYIYYFNYFL